MKSIPKISILVPCYNVAPYLDECLRSIANQTLKDIEIICINDGSTDKTLEIIRRYADGDNRFVVIDKENEGYGKSMNRGLDAATGEYVGIVESDDWIDADMFEKLVAIADKNNVDVVKGNFYEYTTTDGVRNSKVNNMPCDDENIVFCPRDRTNVFFSAPAIWSAIYRREFLVKNNIRFLESPGASYQDTGFNFKVWSMASRVYLTGAAYLHYRCDNAGSSVKSTGKVFCIRDEYADCEQYLSAHNMFGDDMKRLMAYVKLNSYLWNLERLSGAARRQFAVCFSDQYRAHIRAGHIKRERFEYRKWLKILSIVYPYNPIYPVMRAVVKIVAPVYKVRIHGRTKCHFLFGSFVLHRRVLDVLKIGQ